MSSILDALQKLEQDHPARGTNAWLRLLSLRSAAQAARRAPPAWLTGIGLVVGGFLVGATLMFRPGQPQPAPAAPLGPSAPPFVPTQAPPGGLTASGAASPFVSGSTVGLPRPDPRPAEHPLSLQPVEAESGVEPVAEDPWSDARSPEAERTEMATAPAAWLSLLQWAPEAEERIAFITIADGPPTMVYEGDSVGGFTVVKIGRDTVELRSNDSDQAGLILRVR